MLYSEFDVLYFTRRHSYDGSPAAASWHADDCFTTSRPYTQYYIFILSHLYGQYYYYHCIIEYAIDSRKTIYDFVKKKKTK